MNSHDTTKESNIHNQTVLHSLGYSKPLKLGYKKRARSVTRIDAVEFTLLYLHFVSYT